MLRQEHEKKKPDFHRALEVSDDVLDILRDSGASDPTSPLHARFLEETRYAEMLLTTEPEGNPPETR